MTDPQVDEPGVSDAGVPVVRLEQVTKRFADFVAVE